MDVMDLSDLETRMLPMYTYREIYRVPDFAAWVVAHAAAIEKLSNAGARVSRYRVDGSSTAYVNHGRWVVLCDCGSGAEVADDGHDGRPTALCFTCGAVHLDIVHPDERDAIEAALLARRHAPNRNWIPGEDVETLWQENKAHGIER